MPALEYIGSKLAMSAVQPVMSKVGSLLEKEFDHIWKVEDRLRELKVTYLLTQALLSNLDSCHIEETTLEPLLLDVNRYCYDIEDIVDDLDLSIPTKEKGLRNFIFKSLKLTIPHQIGELLKKLQALNSLIEKLLSAGAITTEHPQNGERVPYSKSLYDKTPLVHGTRWNNDKNTIIFELISQQSEHCGVSIIGMDGLGKTSLARTILLDKSISEHFPLVLSASVSSPFQLEEVVKKLVEDHSPLTLEEIVGKEKTLIILDDIWSVSDDEWDRFIYNNLSSSPGWRILTTTRNPKVAEVTKSNSFYLERMEDEDCKKIITDKARLSKFECESWSNDIEVIAKKCMGIPILANMVGLMLSKKQRGVERKNSIIQLKTNKLWDLQEFRAVFPYLNLAEPKLQPDLKRCFAYCSLFPTSHEFNKDDLIQLWEVEGLTQSPQTESSSQGMNCHFQDMLSRSILQPFKSKDKKQTVYKMHEFNHEFAHLLASKAICRIGEGTSDLDSSSKSIRHLSLACHNIDKILMKKIEECEGLRTFLLLHHSHPKKRVVSDNFFHNLLKLRLLDLSHTNISKLSKPKFPSKHLRFLDLSYSSITELPKSVCSIPALCSELLQLPNHFHHLTNLTHLYVDIGLDYPPSSIRNLTKLQVLDSFSVTKDDSCRVVELQEMKHLKEIHMFGLENIRNMEEAQETMLSEKLLLRILVLEWEPITVNNASDVLKGLEPHSDLDDLVVRNYSGENFPHWLVSPSCNITSFELKNCPNCEVLPSLSQLPFLTNLVFRSIDKVKTLDDQFCQEAEIVYPCLELLEFHDMKTLEKWSGLKSGDMPRLSCLKIVNCPKLINLPSFEPLGCLINLEISHCPELLSLPELPSSMNSYSGKLVIIESGLVKSRCEPEGADWPKIDYIPYVEIDFIRIENKSYSPAQENIKCTVSIDEQLSMPEDENNVIQTQANESRSNKNKGKQKVDEGSSCNQVQVAHAPPQNEITEQLEDMEPSTAVIPMF